MGMLEHEISKQRLNNIMFENNEFPHSTLLFNPIVVSYPIPFHYIQFYSTMGLSHLSSLV